MNPRFRVVLLVLLGIIGVFVLIAPRTIEHDKLVQPNMTATAKEEDCMCSGEMMCHRPLIDRKLTIRDTGQRFSCDLLRILKENQLTSPSSQRTTTRISVDDIVFVTYASANHFAESRELILNVTREFPTHRIAYYDVGLEPAQVAELKTQSQIDYHKLDFRKYPPHVRNLSTYAFKATVIAEAYKEFEFFWVVDASFRTRRSDRTEEFVQAMRNGTIPPVTTPIPTAYTNTQLTHFGMYRYLPTARFRSDRVQFGSGVILVKRSPFAAEVMKLTLLCALTEYCIAPLGSYVKCERKNGLLVPQCHRYDQSALNIVLRNVLDESEYRHWAKDLGTRFVNLLNIKRDHRRTKPLEPTACNVKK